MSANSKSLRNAILKGMVGFAGAVGIVPAMAVAEDCKLSVQAAPQVLYRGQTTRIHVYACPSTSTAPNAPYAFASAAFDVLANDMHWSFATDGKIVDSNVLDIEVGQDHQPELGIYADPSNPYRVWGGIIKPQSDEPALVEIEVDPSAFFVYPSKLTSSSVECEAEGGSDLIFMNPLSVGRWLAAPGQGTNLEVHDDVYIEGRIITGENYDSVSVGTTWAGPILLDSSTTIGFDREPSSFKANVQILGAGDDVFQWDPGDGNDAVSPDARRSRIGSMTVTFDGLETGGYSAGANFVFGDGSVRTVRFDAFIGGVYVASGDFENGGDNGIPGLVVYELPQTIEARTGTGRVILTAANTYTGLTMVYDQPIVATIRDSQGLPQVVTLDRIEVRDSHWRKSTFNNELYQPSLGSHVFEAEGVKEIWVAPSQGE